MSSIFTWTNSAIFCQAVPLQVIYEDDDLLVVDKPAGMPVHPSKRQQLGTLANAVVYYWQQSGWSALFRPINRLDKDTSGLVLIGKNQFAHQAIFRQQKNHHLERHYLALVEGVALPDRGYIAVPIARQEDGCAEGWYPRRDRRQQLTMRCWSVINIILCYRSARRRAVPTRSGCTSAMPATQSAETSSTAGHHR